ncbi:TRAP transporter small permease [Marinibaculum pumilum]|uniref:TRAP transporter small permease protein n=1 Tax=Marinibaculum pumilum TaxID=1766165 RepID=A0ABV7L1Q7_9PROT
MSGPDDAERRTSAFTRGLTLAENRIAQYGAGTCLAAMMLVIVISVLGRYLLAADLIPGAYNIIERVLFPLMVFWAIPIAHRDGTFPRLTVLVDRLGPRARLAVSVFVLAVELVIYLILFRFVFEFAWEGVARERMMRIATETWPVYPILVMVPLSFGLMVLEIARLLWRDARMLAGRG